MDKTLIITVGLPRSGKSTWARKQGFPIVNPDSIRLSLHGQLYEPLAEDFVWAIAKVMVRSLFLAGHDTVIVDATNTTASRRKFWINDDWNTKYKFFHLDKILSISRAINGHRQDLVEVINRMYDKFEAISMEEGISTYD